MKKTVISFGVILSIVFLLFLLLPVNNIYLSVMDYSDRHYFEKLEQKWNVRSDKYLLDKLSGNNPTLVGIAAHILCSRNSQEAFPVFKKLVQSKNDDIRWIALQAISSFNNENAMRILLDILGMGIQHKDYLDVLNLLSKMKYEPAYTILIDLATNKNGNIADDKRQYAVTLIEEYGKKESLPILEKLAKNDPSWAVRSSAEDAIKKIKDTLNSKK